MWNKAYIGREKNCVNERKEREEVVMLRLELSVLEIHSLLFLLLGCHGVLKNEQSYR